MMNPQDAKELEDMDVKWLLANGWTIPGNLAYRRILNEFNQRVLQEKGRLFSQERIEQIMMQYELDQSQKEKVKQRLAELVKLKKLLCNPE